MNYVILDLEWDSAYHKRYKRFVNQILQIGAVKLDVDFNIIDSIELTVKSDISKKVSGRFAELTGITTQKMLEGISFENAVKRYNEWVGTDIITMTWSNSDLFTILENEEFLLDGRHSLNIEKYVDLQKYIQGEMRILGFDIVNQVSLSTAAQMLDISTEGFDLHTAKDDSLLASAMLKKCYNIGRFNSMVQDTANVDFYRRLKFKPYNITKLDDPNVDKKCLKFSCEKCNMPLTRVKPWKYRNRWFTTKFVCPKCKGKYSGRVTIKKTYDSVIVRRKLLAVNSETEKPINEMQSVPPQV